MAEEQQSGGGKVDQTHPDYDAILPDWELVRDAIAGETAVKGRSETYLPMPSGFTAQDDGGTAMYASYILRAKFPEIMGPTLRGMVGIIHRVQAEIELPPQLEPLRDVATVDGLSLNALHERITYELMATGRYALLVDAPEEGAEVPYIAGYKAETLINWSLDKDFYVLDETSLARSGFEWEEKEQYRVLELIDGIRYEVRLYEEDASGNLTEQPPIVPSARGGGALEEIPLVVIGSTDVSVDLDEIPLMGVTRCSFTMYRLDADYKWQLFMSGQETLFVYSDTEVPITTVGAGVIHTIPKESQAEYVGPSGNGIAAQKEAIQDERYQAVQAGAKMYDTERKSVESGDALKIRWAAQTASLTTIAINSAKGLENALKMCALFVGANPEQVSVKPNLRFIDTALTPADAAHLVKLWQAGAISYETLWDNLQRGDIGTYERTAEEEMEIIEQEAPDLAVPTDPNAPPAKKPNGTGQPAPTTGKSGVKGGPGTQEEGQPA
jgi:hypothetical protein